MRASAGGVDAFPDGRPVPGYEDLEARHIVMSPWMAPRVERAIGSMRAAQSCPDRRQDKVVPRRWAVLDLDR